MKRQTQKGKQAQPQMSLRHFLIPVLICALLCAGVPSVLILTGHPEPVRAVVNTLLTPLSSLFASAGDGVDDVFSYFTAVDALKEENERLRRQLASMEEKLREAELTMEENAFLSAFLTLKQDHDDYRFLKCEVVAEDRTGYRQVLTLNAGYAAGVQVGYPVISASGVIGRVVEVGVNWSKAEPITSISSAVGVYVERTGESGVAEGSYLYSDDGKLLLSYLGADTDIMIGDRIRTAGVNSYYPRGLLVGDISAVTVDHATGERTAVITPTAPLSDLRDVMVLTDFAIYDTDPPVTNENAADTAEEDPASK